MMTGTKALAQRVIGHPTLLRDIQVIRAEVIKRWVKAKYAVRILVMVAQHTFGSNLKFNPQRCYRFLPKSAAATGVLRSRQIGSAMRSYRSTPSNLILKA